MPARMSFTLPNTQVPTSGPVGIPDLLDFTNTANVSHDYGLEQMQGVIEFVQAIYIDNSKNANPVAISFGGLQYNIQCRGGRQGIWPVIAPSGILTLTASATVGMKVPIILANAQLSNFAWDV